MTSAIRIFAATMAVIIVSLTALYFANRDAINFARLPPQEKFVVAWKRDLLLLEKSQKLPPQWKNIRRIEVRSEPSPARDWLEHVTPPIAVNPSGLFELHLFVIHWINEGRYGVILEYSLLDTKTGNTIWEAARTLKLGLVY